MYELDDLLREYFRKHNIKEYEDCGKTYYTPRVDVNQDLELIARYEGELVHSIVVSDDPYEHIRVNLDDHGCSYWSVRPDHIVDNLEVFKVVKIY